MAWCSPITITTSSSFRSATARLRFNLLMTETDPRDVKLELDVYWVAKAGQDPVQYLKDGQDRIVARAPEGPGIATARPRKWAEASWTLNGSSGRRFSLGVKHLFVEQDSFGRSAAQASEPACGFSSDCLPT